MKTFFRRVFCILQSMGQARAAACLARHGQIEAAKRVLLLDEGCKW